MHSSYCRCQAEARPSLRTVATYSTTEAGFSIWTSSVAFQKEERQGEGEWGAGGGAQPYDLFDYSHRRGGIWFRFIASHFFLNT
jgi:hypothetical protein